MSADDDLVRLLMAVRAIYARGNSDRPTMYFVTARDLERLFEVANQVDEARRKRKGMV